MWMHVLPACMPVHCLTFLVSVENRLPTDRHWGQIVDYGLTDMGGGQIAQAFQKTSRSILFSCCFEREYFISSSSSKWIETVSLDKYIDNKVFSSMFKIKHHSLQMTDCIFSFMVWSLFSMPIVHSLGQIRKDQWGQLQSTVGQGFRDTRREPPSGSSLYFGI